MVVLQDFVSGATRVAVAGDWHGDVVPVRRILSKVARQGAQVVLHVGDFGYFPGRVEYWAFIAEVNARAELHDYVVCLWRVTMSSLIVRWALLGVRVRCLLVRA